jgi:hypothetical protein
MAEPLSKLFMLGQPNWRKLIKVPSHNLEQRERFAVVECYLARIKLEYPLTSAARYRGYAAECIRVAHQAANPADRALLLRMADRWIRHAERAAKRSDPDEFENGDPDEFKNGEP